ELYYYFFRYGASNGIFGVFISALLFAAAAYKTLRINAAYDISGYSGLLELLFGKLWGKIFYMTSVSFFLVLFAAMAASFGEIARMTGISAHIGSFCFCVFCCIAASYRKNGCERINFLLCPIILLCCPLLGLT
ncbi:MAG: hypothetical protein IJR45_03375, partial [Firmicutes bacterium]|nr:hypothetical protein [Bacillota bacterium]